MTGQCHLPPHDATAFALSLLVCVGVVVSYLPQIWRIVHAKSSVGLSPWFLFLGTTSSWSATLNVLVLQWHVLVCSFKSLNWGTLEHSMGVLQTALQQIMFTLVFAYFLVYYPVDQAHMRRSKRRQRRQRHAPQDTAHLSLPDDGMDSSGSDSDLENVHAHLNRSYGATSTSRPAVDSPSLVTHARRHDAYGNIPAAMRQILERHHLPGEEEIAGKVGSAQELRGAQRLATVAAVYALVILTVSLTLLSVHARRRYLEHWAGVLGVLGGLLAMWQYLPQLVHTARARLVRSVSISMMAVQVPGSLLFMYALAGRDGVNWTTMVPYAVAAVLQGTLLLLCVVWKVRQAREGIDDYGRPLASAALS